MPPPDVFEQFGLARYTPAGGTTFQLRAVMASDAAERRLVERRRPYLERAAPVDDTGPNNDTFQISVLFARSDEVLASLVGEAVYPQYHARFLREARQGGTATLYFPGRGEKRVKLQRRDARQDPGERDSEVVQLTLIEDGEDERAGASSFNLPSAKSAGPVLLRRFADAAAPNGIGGDLLAQLEAAIGSLEATANAPFTAASLIGTRAQRVLDVCGRIRRLYTSKVPGAPPLFAPLRPPGAAEALAAISQIEGYAAAQRAALFGAGSVRARRFTETLSIFDIAARLGQPVDDLIRLNGTLPLFGIPPGVEVLTRAT